MGPCKHCHRLTCICEPIAYTDHDRAAHLSTLSARVVEALIAAKEGR